MSISREEVIHLIRDSDREIPQRNKYYGVYVGIVEDNKDPLRLNRLRVRTAVYPDPVGMPTKALPWAHFVSPSGGAKDVGFYAVPPVGAQVAVEFLDGDPSYPVWTGTVWGAPKGVSDPYVNRIKEFIDPTTEEVVFPPLWDHTQYSSYTTPYGHRLVFDDNVQKDSLDRVANFASVRLDTPRGFFFYMKEDKSQTYKDTSKEEHRGILSMGTRDGRVLEFDDDLEKITISTPDNHVMIMDSILDMMILQTGGGNRLVLFDLGRTIDLSSPGTDPGDERGYRLLMSEYEERVLLKGFKSKYFLEMLETGGGHFGMFSKYPSKKDAGIQILDFYGGAQRDVVNLYANDGRGFGVNGVLLDRGSSSANRSTSVYLYDDSRTTPSNWIRIVSVPLAAGETKGMIMLGRRDRANTIILDPSTVSIQVITSTLQLLANRIVMKPSLGGSGGDDLLTLHGPFTSKYFRHLHRVVCSRGGTSRHVSNALAWKLSNVVLSGTGSFPGGSGAFSITVATGQMDVEKTLEADRTHKDG